MEAAFPRTAVMVPTCWTFPAPTIRRRSRFECIKPSTSHRTGDRSIHHDAENDPSRKFLQTMICIISLSKCFGQLEIFELHSFIILLWFYQKCVCNSQHTYYVLYVHVCVFNLCVFFGLPGSASSHSGRLDARLPRSRQEPAAVSAHDVSPTTAEEDTRRCAKTYKKLQNVSSNFNSMVLALRLLYGAVKNHLADFANIMSFMQLVIWVIPHCVIILLYVHFVITSVRVGFNARCWSAFGTHDAGPGRHCFLLSSFTALRDRSRCEYQGPGDIEVSTLVGSWDNHVGSIPPGRWCSTDDLNIDKMFEQFLQGSFMYFHVVTCCTPLHYHLHRLHHIESRWLNSQKVD